MQAPGQEALILLRYRTPLKTDDISMDTLNTLVKHELLSYSSQYEIVDMQRTFIVVSDSFSA